tara:strand:+ start:726 stop:1442 length:717 start_codon:yes stop_codon:yes gene_type:complete
MRFKLYILISLIIHTIILLFLPLNIKREKLKGEKITPIEIIRNESFNTSRGNTNKNSLRNFSKKIQDKKKLIKKENEIKDSKEQKLKDINGNFKGDFQIKKKEIEEKNEIKNKDKSLIKENKLKISEVSNSQKKGFSDKEANKDIEKGSVKGIGKLKITCLKCISPIYPRKALREGLEGKPTVKVWILKSGDIEKAEIINSSGVSSIDNAALEAARKSKFYPIPFDSFLNIEYDLKLR